MTETDNRVDAGFVVITEAARQHFSSLLAAEDAEDMNFRIKVANPETPHAEISVTFCLPSEEEPLDVPVSCGEFTIFIDEGSKPALLDAIIDFKEDALGGQLSIKAPHLKGHAPAVDKPLQDRVQYVIDSEINPNLAGHGGHVSIVEILKP